VGGFCLANAARFFAKSFLQNHIQTRTLPKKERKITSPMKLLTLFKTTIPSLLVSVLLACFALCQMAQAVSPAPDGGYPGGTTAEGTDALLSLSSGIWNTAGFEALNHLTAGNQNTATGLRALTSDINGGFNTATGD
jgi:hypothetical protein